MSQVPVRAGARAGVGSVRRVETHSHVPAIPITSSTTERAWPCACVRGPRPGQGREAATPKPGCRKQAMAWRKAVLPLSQS